MQPSRPLLLVLFSGLLLALRIANAQGSESVAPAAANSPSPEPSKPIVPSIECGHWQKDYTARHAAMLRGEIPAKWAIATGPNGLADTLLGSVSVFYMALVSGRAFLMRDKYDPDCPSCQPRLEWAYAQPNINWTVPDEINRSILAPKEIRELKAHTIYDDASSVVHTILHTGVPEWIGAWDAWYTQDTVQWAEKYRTVHVLAARGMTWKMFDNPHLGPKLDALGIPRENAFACALNFLIDLQPSVQHRFARVQQALAPVTHSGDKVLRVGIQIRTGDATLRGRDLGGAEQLLQRFDAFFDCAQQITDTRGGAYKRVVWYLVTDSIAIKKAAVEKYGERVLTDVSYVPAHIQDHTARSNTTLELAVQSSAADNWLLHLADVFVITKYSGYGRTAALWSTHVDSIYTINCCEFDSAPPKRSCRIEDYDRLAEIAEQYSQL